MFQLRMSTDDFIVVGPIHEGPYSLFLLFQWHGYREPCQGYRCIARTTTHHIEMQIHVLTSSAAKRQLPNLTDWIDDAIEEFTGV